MNQCHCKPHAIYISPVGEWVTMIECKIKIQTSANVLCEEMRLTLLIISLVSLANFSKCFIMLHVFWIVLKLHVCFLFFFLFFRILCIKMLLIFLTVFFLFQYLSIIFFPFSFWNFFYTEGRIPLLKKINKSKMIPKHTRKMNTIKIYFSPQSC